MCCLLQCGVKRTRKLRAEQEGAKRRKTTGSPSPAPLKHAAYPKLPPKAPTYSPGAQQAQQLHGAAGSLVWSIEKGHVFSCA